MAILPIPAVVPDTDILADWANRLRDGIQDKVGGHDHNGDDYHGKPIDHAWLIDAGTHDHVGTGLNNTLDWHMDAVQGSADHALHGLTPNYYVAGSHGQQLALKALEYQCTTENSVSHACADYGGGHVQLLGWPKVFTAADLGLATIIGCSISLEHWRGGDSNDPWPNPFIFRAGTWTSSDWNCHVASDGGAWNRGLGGSHPYSFVVPSGGLGVFLVIRHSQTGSWGTWWNAAGGATDATLPLMKLLAWGLL